MTGNGKTRPITIDLNEFKLHVALKNRIELTLHFNSPSRRFYLSVIALVVNEMKRQGKVTSIPLERYQDLLALLNETIGGSAGLSEKEHLLPRIYRKWQHALPNLEEAPLFTVLGKKKGYEEGVGKTYHFTEAEKDSWANLFEYKGSEENVRLKFAVDRIGAGLDDVEIIYEGGSDGDAWERFLSNLKGRVENIPETEATPYPSEAPGPSVSVPEEKRTAWQSRLRWVALVTVIVAFIGVGTLVFWKLYLEPGRLERASVERMDFPLPEKPSIAVLPFVNMSGDPQQEYFSDGISDDIITALSKLPLLFVISRQSTFSYKGKRVKVKQVSEELGIRYVLEGSVQRSGERIRINAQLVDALTGRHIWAGRYDRDLTDLFALQDEITLRVLTAVQVKLTDGEQASMKEKSYEKYYKGKQGLDCYLKGLEFQKYYRGLNIEDNRVARRIAEEMIEMCPGSPVPYFFMGHVHLMESWWRTGKSPQESLEKGIEMAQKALAMDDSNPWPHALLAQLYTYKREYDKAIAEGERAVALAPGGSSVHMQYGICLSWAGRPEEAIPLLQKAIRLDPIGTTSLYVNYGSALENARRFEEAVAAYKKSVQREPNNIFAHLGLTSTYSKMGREKEARAEAAEVLRINPKFSVDNFAKALPLKDQSEIDKCVNAYRKAGLK
jgi:adenylate cyclase